MEYQHLLDYWFDNVFDQPEKLVERNTLWWTKNPETDQYIIQQFSALHQKARDKQLQHWLDSLKGRLALIILLDQFSRNMFRDNSKAFAQDPQALELALAAINQGEDQNLNLLERTFLYMPLEHAEDLALQNHCVDLFQSLHDQDHSQTKPVFLDFLDYAKQHRDIIEKFGRFPHRNIILGRPSTPEEEAFLKQPNSSF